MKTHRPWQPHLGNTPLFNPYTPAGASTTLDQFDLREEVEDAEEIEGDEHALPEEAGDPPSLIRRD